MREYIPNNGISITPWDKDQVQKNLLLTYSVSSRCMSQMDLTAAALVNTLLPLQELTVLRNCPKQKITLPHEKHKTHPTDSLLQCILTTELLKRTRNCLLIKAVFPTREQPSLAKAGINIKYVSNDSRTQKPSMNPAKTKSQCLIQNLFLLQIRGTSWTIWICLGDFL